MSRERLYTFIGVVGAAACLGLSFAYIFPLLRAWAVLPDFTIFWTAGKVALENSPQVYDTTAITAAQSWAVDPAHGPRPFSYPPSALFLFIPFGLLPFWLAYWTWVVLSAIAFWSAARRIADGWALPLSLATPQVILVLILGQTTLVLGSLIIWSLTLLRERPVVAGLLMGVAAAIKPQTVLLAPVALISGGHWKALASSAATFLVLVVCSLVFGLSIWSDWLSAVRAFPQEVLEAHRLFALGATPWMAGRTLGLVPPALFILQACGIAAGLCAVWYAFKSENIGLQLCALVLGGLLVSPYALRYDLATLAPIFATGLLSGTLLGLIVSLPLFALNSLAIVPAIAASLSSQFLRTLRHPKRAEVQSVGFSRVPTE